MLCLAIVILLIARTAIAQTDSLSRRAEQCIDAISNKSLRLLDNKYSVMQQLIQRHTESVLRRMQKKEQALEAKLMSKDSLLAKQLFAATQQKYLQLSAQLDQPTAGVAAYAGGAVPAGVAGFAGGAVPAGVASYKQYVPGLDSMMTAVQFLNQKGAGLSSVPAAKLQRLQALEQQMQQLQAKWNAAGNVQDYIRQREQTLKQQLGSFNLAGKLSGVNQEVYYYQARLSEYKSMLNDRDKLQETILSAVRQIPAFQSYWQRYSILGQFFPPPPGLGTTAALNGLQTSSSIQAIVQKAGGSIGPNTEYMQQQSDEGQSTLNKLKDRVASLGGTSGSGDMTMPDFTPNSQHNKTFLKRLEYGFNIQSASASGLLPSTSNIALTVGYKFSDKMTAGVGASYVMGWGSGFNHIAITNQGVGMRGYMDVKVKGSWWATGGFEYTYYQEFYRLRDIYNIDVWQKSALIGVTRKISIGKRSVNLQVLYDLLSNSEIPRGQAFRFRTGYSF